MKILIIGSGGREHALAWKIAQSPRVSELYVAPGNGGTSKVAKNISIEATDIESLVKFAKENAIDITVVGPDDVLALGIVDAFQKHGLYIFGPTKASAEIESSKAFAKQLMWEENIPTAPGRIFNDYNSALDFIREHGAPIVVKASGLALGKGVYPCNTIIEAENALAEIMLKRVHKDAGSEVIIEDFLEGQEISIHAFCDGKTSVLFPSAQDHKTVFDNNEGKNTGGMGTIAPIPWVTADIMQFGQDVVASTLDALSKRKKPFIGCLYPGIKMTPSGPMILEFNSRFGDPETQSYMRLLKTDVVDILEACINGNLSECKIDWNSGFAVCIVLASGGYPQKYEKGKSIFGIDKAEKLPGVVIFHAGTKQAETLQTSGGRVLGVTAIGETLPDALKSAYKAVSFIEFEGMHYRKDIGMKSIF